MTTTAPATSLLPDSFRTPRDPQDVAEAAALRDRWVAAEQGHESQSFWSMTGRRFLENRTGVVAASVLLLLILASVLAPLLTPYDPLVGVAQERLAPPFSPGHPLGTDEQGRDLLSRLLHGGRLTLVAAFVPTIAATVVGTAIGLSAAMFGGWVQAVLMRSMDMLYAFPAVLLAIAISASLGPGLANALISTAVVSVPPVARVAESATRRVVTTEYIEAARLAGARPWRIATQQVLPNVLNDVIVYASSLVGVSMLIAASLSFLGLGSLPPAPEWGYMLNSLRGSISVALANVLLPGLFIFLTSVCFNLASDALREATDSRI